jgi:hypothetical protein
MRGHGKLQTLLLALLMLAAGSEFLWRGPVRFLRESGDWNDLLPVYIPARAWVRGADPYSPASYTNSLMRALKEPWNPAVSQRAIPPYPLSTFVLLSPLAALPWPVARWVWLGSEMALIAAMIVCLVLLDELENKTAWILIALILALAPLHSGIATGNLSIVTTAIACIGVWAMRGQRKTLAGILFAVTIALKPQIGLCFLAYYLLRRQWRPCGLAIAGSAATWLAGAWRLHAIGLFWASELARNARLFVGSNRYDDFSSINPMRFTLIDLQVPYFDLTGGKKSAALLALATVAVLGAIAVLLILKMRMPDDVLSLSVLTILSLLPVYHRFYDASLLVLPMAWSFSKRFPEQKAIRWMYWCLILPFFVPAAAFLERAAAQSRIPRAVVQSWWWRHVVMPHEIWALLLLALLLLYAMKLGMAQQASATELIPQRSSERVQPSIAS